MNYSGIKLHLFFLMLFIISACNQEKPKNESIKEQQIGYLGKTELKPNAYSVNPIFRDTFERDSNRVGFLKNNLRLHDSFVVSDRDSVGFNLQKDGPLFESNIENAIIESAGFSLENCFSATIKRPKGRVESFLNGKLLQTNLSDQEIPIAEYIGNTRYRDNFMYDISYLDKEHGLTASFIWSLEVDREGALWVGSRKGMLRYEGNYVQKFSQGTLSGSINDIFQDSKENF